MFQFVKDGLIQMDLSLKNFARSLVIGMTTALMSVALLCGLSVIAIAQDADAPGMEELNKAFDKKINSTSTRDLDEVARLCEQAIEKGLKGDAAEQAKMLAKTAYYEHADQLANRIFSMTSETDPRWQRMRREALRRLEKTVKLDPDMASAYVLMARLNSLPRGDNEEGMDAAETAIDMIEDDDELLAQALMAKVALKLAREKKPEDVVDEIMEDINRAIKLDPNNEQARFLRSKLLARTGKITESLEDLDAALANTNSEAAYKLEANRLITNKQFADSPEMQAAALRYLDKAMELKEDPNLLLTKAIVYQVMKNPEDALAAVDEHLEAEPENVRAYLLRSALNAEQKKLDDAIADLDKASEIKPDELSIYRNRIGLHVINEDLDAAIQDSKKLNEKQPGEYVFQIQLVGLYLTAERPLAAAKVASEMLEDLEDGVWENERGIVGYQLAMRRLETLRLRGGAYLNGGKHEKAIDDYEAAVEMTDVIYELQQQISPRMKAQLKMDDFDGDAGLLNNLAWVLATSTVDKLRDGERAVELAEKAADLTDYKEAYILSTLASAYAEVGDFEKAIEWSEKAVERNREELEEFAADEELNEETKEREIKNSEEQLESLEKELASYQDEKPWREMQSSDEKEIEESDEDNDSDADDDEKEMKGKNEAEENESEESSSNDDDDLDDEDNDDENGEEDQEEMNGEDDATDSESEESSSGDEDNDSDDNDSDDDDSDDDDSDDDDSDDDDSDDDDSDDADSDDDDSDDEDGYSDDEDETEESDS